MPYQNVVIGRPKRNTHARNRFPTNVARGPVSFLFEPLERDPDHVPSIQQKFPLYQAVIRRGLHRRKPSFA
jgi:hypothetical protein